MISKSLVRRQFIPVALVLLLALGIVGWFSLGSLREFIFKQAQDDLQVRAELLRPQMASLLKTSSPKELQKACLGFGSSARARVTLVGYDGSVLCDSEEDPSRLAHHGSWSEILQAVKGKPGYEVRVDPYNNERTLFVAVPIMEGGKVAAVIRTSLPLSFLGKTVDNLAWPLSFAVLLFALFAGFMLFYFSKGVVRHVGQVKSGAERFAEGDFSFRLPLTEIREFDGLSQALNNMAAQLDDRIRTITEQRNEQEAILTSMVEGVFAIDPDEIVIHLNQAAGRLFGINPQQAQGKPLQAVVRNTQLLDFVKKALSSGDLLERDIELIWEGQVRFLQTRGTILRNTRNESIGAVFVLYDITRLRKLETMRRDFVANVSHELKTPITSIKGFVETLLDGALESPEDTRRFLGIVSKQAERLNAIIEDLLSLSRIEQDSETREIVKQDCQLREVLENAIGDCSPKANAKDIFLNLECDTKLRAKVNPPLLEEAVVNLVDNAIKYSDSQKRVEIAAIRDNGEVVIQVKDQGRGIDTQHLPRLFERFYRVDKARSRQMGGTGLGLAIVKHITQAHGGSVDVESNPGSGSIFSIHLPDKN
ncbi:MAG: PAS domain-containing protein [Candidatus Nitronauta litoralis]|uniref:histidine kinase n=1 Tax=Candidatus Nitronauta litoralis TaxID=2705533 RepID=A0A7T0BWU1_9BACT|nr:MAG: PAS domain-containing protein [Candidatus Nitronauta litoralis]